MLVIVPVRVCWPASSWHPHTVSEKPVAMASSTKTSWETLCGSSVQGRGGIFLHGFKETLAIILSPEVEWVVFVASCGVTEWPSVTLSEMTCEWSIHVLESALPAWPYLCQIRLSVSWWQCYQEVDHFLSCDEQSWVLNKLPLMSVLSRIMNIPIHSAW